MVSAEERKRQCKGTISVGDGKKVLVRVGWNVSLKM